MKSSLSLITEIAVGTTSASTREVIDQLQRAVD